MACRNLEKGEAAKREIEAAAPGAAAELEHLDLSSLDSVRAFAGRFSGLLEQRGHPKPVSPNRAARDEDVARRLWDVSEEMTGVHFELGAAERQQ